MILQVSPLLPLLYLLASAPALANSFGSSDDAPYELCALCHGLDGVSRMAKFPKLAGQPQAYIEKQLANFRTQERSNDGGQMVAIVTEITAQDIPVVAQWFAKQTPPPPEDATPDGISAGKAAFETLGCPACHDPAQAKGTTPHLTSQHQAYLSKQMTDFRDGARANDPDGLMSAAMKPASDAQIRAISQYLSATPRQP